MTNFFELLNQEQKFDLNLADLEKNLIEAQMQFHPDNFLEHSEQTVHTSALINQAYATLKDPFKRAEYLLSLYGVSLEGVAMGPEFLMQQMELREAVGAGVRASPFLKGVPNESEGGDFLEEINNRYLELEKILKITNPENLRLAARLLAELQFFIKLK